MSASWDEQSGHAREVTDSDVRDAVRALLARSTAYASLPSDERRKVAEDMESVVRRAAVAQAGAPPGTSLQAVNFPEFVAGLIQGVFDAMVDASLQQMREYAKLVGEVARSVETLDAAEREATEASARRDLAEQRQAMLATMVLMGINRIVVTDGEIKAKVDFDVRATEPRRDDSGGAKPPRRPRRRRDP